MKWTLTVELGRVKDRAAHIHEDLSMYPDFYEETFDAQPPIPPEGALIEVYPSSNESDSTITVTVGEVFIDYRKREITIRPL